MIALLATAIPLIILAAWVDWRRRKRNRNITHSELLAGMRALELQRPMASRIEGDPQWRDPRKRRRKAKVVEVTAKVAVIDKRKKA